MTDLFFTHGFSKARHQTENELLATLLLNDTTYPWNPSEPESDQYFDALQRQSLLTEDDLTEVESSAVQFYASLAQAWVNVDSSTSVLGGLGRLQGLLAQKFAARVPQGILKTIAQEAYKTVTSPLPLAERLVNCVQDALPSWDMDDLLVLARPLAYAMRNADANDPVTQQSMLSTQWSDLSEIEQARLSLVIAHYALLQSTADS